MLNVSTVRENFLFCVLFTCLFLDLFVFNVCRGCFHHLDGWPCFVHPSYANEFLLVLKITK